MDDENLPARGDFSDRNDGDRMAESVEKQAEMLEKKRKGLQRRLKKAEEKLV